MIEPAGETKITRQGDELLYPKLVFNRPVNPIQQPIIVFVHESLPALNQSYEVAEVLKIKPQAVLISAQSPEQPLQSEATLGLQTIKPTDQAQLSEMLEAAETNASLLSIGFDSALPSAIQIALEQFLLASTVPVILSGSLWQLLAANPALLEKTNLVLNFDTIEMIKLLNALHIPVHTSDARGVYQLVDLAQSLLRRQPTLHLIIADNANVVMAVRQADVTHIGLWHSRMPMPTLAAKWNGLAAAMLAYPLRNITDNFCERLLNGAYLLQNSIVNERAITISLRRMYDSLNN